MVMLLLILLALSTAWAHIDVVPAGPFTQGEPIPADGFRVTALGTGNPTVQVQAYR